MSFHEHYAQSKFGIDEVYIHDGLAIDLLNKLYQRAEFTLDGDDNIIKTHVGYDMVLVFNKQVPSDSMIRRFVKLVDQDPQKAEFLRSNTLLNVDELFSAIKSKTFVLVTHRTLVKENHCPTT